MKYLFLLIICAAFWVPVRAEEIAAIVGDSPISTYDVKQRAALISLQQPGFASQLSSSQKNKKVLDILIDDKIKVQEATKQGIVITDEDIQNAIGRLEKQNHMAPGGMAKTLKDHHIAMDTLRAQVMADLMWLQVMQKNRENLSPVGDNEIAVKKEQIKSELAEPSFLIGEILVADENEADKIFDQVRGGANFAEIAKEKSIAKSAANDGLLGWIKTDHYPASINMVLMQMQKGQLSRPLKTPDGTLLIYMIDKKQAAPDGQIEVWQLAQMATRKDQTVKLIPTILGAANCTEFLKIAGQHAIKESVQNGLVSPSSLPPQLKSALDKQKISSALGPINMPEGDLFFMKCSQKKQSLLPSDEEIKSMLEMKKMEGLSDKLLRQVKRYAVIEYK